MNVDPRDIWRKPSTYSPVWDERAKIVVSLLGDVESVCDIGCGAPQTMRRILRPSIRYYPADLEQWSPDTETCDLNAGLYPTRSLKRADACLMIGVLEYLNDPLSVLVAINKHCKRLILSYHPTDLRPDNRHAAWIQNIREDQLLELAALAGWERQDRIKLDNGQMIYDFEATFRVKLKKWLGLVHK